VNRQPETVNRPLNRTQFFSNGRDQDKPSGNSDIYSTDNNDTIAYRNAMRNTGRVNSSSGRDRNVNNSAQKSSGRRNDRTNELENSQNYMTYLNRSYKTRQLSINDG